MTLNELWKVALKGGWVEMHYGIRLAFSFIELYFIKIDESHCCGNSQTKIIAIL